MKRKTTFALLVISFFFCQKINSQSFVDEGNQWSLVYYTFAGDGNTTTYRIEGDTIINGVDYKKMLVTNENPATSVNWNLSKIIREDSTQKVFTFADINNEVLLYDFGLLVGDTIYSNINPDELAIVEAIDSTELNDGSKRKRLDLKSLTCPNLNDDEYWIEGVGGVTHAMSFIENFCATDVHLSLRCFSNSGNFLFGSSDGSNCFVTTSTYEIEQTTINIFPNPTQNMLNLEYAENIKIEKVNIFDFQGQAIKSLQPAHQISQVNISNIPNGVYFLKIETNQKEFIFKKFTKIN